jgi:hypothetical protein
MSTPRARWTALLRPTRGRCLDALLLGALLAMCVLVSRAYVKQEHWIYYWDQAVYQDIARDTTEAFGRSWQAGFTYLTHSFNQDYNALFAVPLVPIMRFLGDSRLAFVTALSIVCLGPLALSMGVLATRLVRAPSRVVFWSGAWLTLLVPITWVPTLRGFPDALPASLVIVSLALALRERGLARWPGAALSGGLLAMAAILRRHFVYADLAVFESVALYGLLRVAVDRRARREDWLREGRAVLLWLVVAGSAAGAVLLTIGHGFVRRSMAFDFMALYRAYENPLGFVLRWFLEPYGWTTLVAAAAGLVLGPWLGFTHHRRVALFGLYATVSAVQWLLIVRQVGENYTLHFTPVVAVGLVCAGCCAWRISPPRWRAALIVLTFLWLLGSATLGLSTLKAGKDSFWRLALAAQWEPLRRYDYDAVLNLAQFLREYGPAEARVYVAASSHVINPDIVRQAGRLEHGRLPGGLDVLRVPEVDSRDAYPVGALTIADMVVVAAPTQYHLSPAEQRSVAVVHDLFSHGLAVARDFERLPPTFPLMHDVGVTVFRRIRPTTLETARATLRIVMEYLPRRPGMQSQWVRFGGPYRSWLDLLPDGTTEWVAHPVPRGYSPATALCSVEAPDAITALTGEISFVDGRCAGAALAFSALDSRLRRRSTTEVRARPHEPGGFALRLDTRGADHVLVELVSYAPGTSIDYCLLKVRLTSAGAD